MKVGVFDSGVGAVGIIAAIKKELPEIEIIYKDDHEHLPYGSKSIGQIHQLVQPIFKSFLNDGCEAIVVACNTVTTNLISRLRQDFNVPMVGMEPAVKPAAVASHTGVIAVFATPRTLSSARYAWLKQHFTQGIKVLEPDCADWALMIENNELERKKIDTVINSVCEASADQIVLGCTHYHWIEAEIREVAAGRAEVIQPTEPVITQLKKVLKQLA